MYKNEMTNTLRRWFLIIALAVITQVALSPAHAARLAGVSFPPNEPLKQGILGRQP